MNSWGLAASVVGVTVLIIAAICFITYGLVTLLGDAGGFLSVGLVMLGMFLAIGLAGHA